MTVGGLYERLEAVFPKELSCEWDNDGLMYCFDKNRQVKKVLITLDATEAAIDHALENGFDTIVTHHPLIFKPLRRLDFEGAVGARLKKIVKGDLAVMSFHTRLDCVGVNDCLASALGLLDVSDFCLDDGLPMGRIGLLEKEETVRNFALRIKNALSAQTVGYPHIDGAVVRKIAILGGSGADAISAAMKLGADGLVTGECSYNKIIDSAETGLYIFTAGHFDSENKVCSYIYDRIKEIDPEIICHIYDSGIIANI